MNLMSLIVAAHVATGTVALATYWTAGLAQKGSPLHRRAGHGFLLAMLGILLTGALLALDALRSGKENAAAFLGAEHLDEETAAVTLGAVLKDHDDQQLASERLGEVVPDAGP